MKSVGQNPDKDHLSLGVPIKFMGFQMGGWGVVFRIDFPIFDCQILAVFSCQNPQKLAFGFSPKSPKFSMTKAPPFSKQL